MFELRTHLRAYLGTDLLPHLEAHMSEITDALNRLAQQVNGVSAAQAVSFTNLQNAINDLKAGKLNAEQAEIVGRIEAALTKLGEDAQAGDDGFEPTPVEGETPVVTDPQTGEEPTVPVEDGPVVEENTTSRKR